MIFTLVVSEVDDKAFVLSKPAKCARFAVENFLGYARRLGGVDMGSFLSVPVVSLRSWAIRYPMSILDSIEFEPTMGEPSFMTQARDNPWR